MNKKRGKKGKGKGNTSNVVSRYEEDAKEKSEGSSAQMDGEFKPVLVEETMRRSITSASSAKSSTKKKSFI